jgi:hypothetical protein
MLFLFNILVFGKIMVVKLNEILESRRFYILVIFSQMILIIPQLIVYIIGFIEIYFIGKLMYSYLLLPMLLLPLIWKGYIYVLYEFYYSRIKPEANPSFQIVWDLTEHFSWDSVQPRDINKIDIIPIADDVKQLSKKDLVELGNYYRYCVCRYFLCQIIRNRNDTIIHKYSMIMLILRILFLIRLFYSLPPILPIDSTILISMWE